VASNTLSGSRRYRLSLEGKGVKFKVNSIQEYKQLFQSDIQMNYPDVFMPVKEQILISRIRIINQFHRFEQP
jgi:hypothetical protein